MHKQKLAIESPVHYIAFFTVSILEHYLVLGLAYALALASLSKELRQTLSNLSGVLSI